MVALVALGLCMGCGGGEDLPRTTQELCEAVAIRTCELEAELGCSSVRAEWCANDVLAGGIREWKCCEALNCASARPVTEQEAAACLDAVELEFDEQYGCYLIEQDHVPAACQG